MERLDVPKTPITVLTCGLDEEDRETLETVFKAAASLKFIHTGNIGEATPSLLKLSAEVVVAEKELDDGSWEQLLKVTPRSFVVVVDRLADDEMWSQVLAAKGHDLVGSQPFDQRAIEHAVVAAWHHWIQRWGKS